MPNSENRFSPDPPGNGGDPGDDLPLDVPHTIEEVIEQTETLGDHKPSDNGGSKDG
jgi:hypothetical protein